MKNKLLSERIIATTLLIAVMVVLYSLAISGLLYATDVIAFVACVSLFSLLTGLLIAAIRAIWFEDEKERDPYDPMID